MMKTYLGGKEEALDGFEFLSMAEAGELCHWEMVQKIADTVGERSVAELADWAVPVQQGTHPDRARGVAGACRRGGLRRWRRPERLLISSRPACSAAGLRRGGPARCGRSPSW